MHDKVGITIEETEEIEEAVTVTVVLVVGAAVDLIM